MNRSLVVATALLVPALVFVSCKDDGNSNPVGPDNPNTPSAKAAPTKIAAAKAVKPRVHVALREGVGAQAVGPAQHDPLPFGQPVTCLDGSSFEVGNPGVSNRFDNNRGCEVDTYLDNTVDEAEAGLRLTSRASYSGKRIDALNTVNARFAGGGPNDSDGDRPFWQIPIDECESVTSTGVSAQLECSSGTATDGFLDEYAFITFSDCTDDPPETAGGDRFTGASRAEDDDTCEIEYDGNFFDNWDDFERGQDNGGGSHPELIGARIARTNGATGAAEHILIVAENYVTDDGWHGLIHRVNVQ